MCESEFVEAQKQVSLLFIYGRSGSGKTRLLQRIEEALDGVQGVMVRGCEQILRDMVQSVTDRTYDDFFERYCSVENLLVDNLWVLRTRPRSTVGLGRLLGGRMDRGNLTILTSDLTVHDVINTLPAIGHYLKDGRAAHIAIKLHERLAQGPQARCLQQG